MSKCMDCGNDIDTGGDNLRCSGCKQTQFNKPFGIQGWICPVCQAGISPYTSRCSCKGYPPMKVNF